MSPKSLGSLQAHTSVIGSSVHSLLVYVDLFDHMKSNLREHCSIPNSPTINRPINTCYMARLGLLTSASRLSLLHHSRYSVVPSIAITFGHEPAA